MRRYHFFEFCDQSWIPNFIRIGYMNNLNLIQKTFCPYQNVPALLLEWADENAINEFCDLASGGGEQISVLLEKSVKEFNLKFKLTDLYPQIKSYQDLQKKYGVSKIIYDTESISIFNLPKGEKNFTIFSAFHHFDKYQAELIISDIATNYNSICIFEFTSRSLKDLLSMIPAIFFNWISPFLSKKKSLTTIIFGFLIPIIPILVVFDGVISVLRSYKMEEIEKMIPPELKNNFKIKYGTLPWGKIPFAKMNYFLMVRVQTNPEVKN